MSCGFWAAGIVGALFACLNPNIGMPAVALTMMVLRYTVGANTLRPLCTAFGGVRLVLAVVKNEL
eukprot:4733138-Prymnesium_polylepis.1